MGQKESYKLQISKFCQYWNKTVSITSTQRVQITKHPINPEFFFLENTNKKNMADNDSQQLNKFYISEAMLLVFTAITKCTCIHSEIKHI